MVYSVTLTFIFKFNIFLRCICYKNSAGSECSRQMCLDMHGPAMALLLFDQANALIYNQMLFFLKFDASLNVVTAIIKKMRKDKILICGTGIKKNVYTYVLY